MASSAAFFDLDKTVIAKSSALAFGRPFYRDGLITRSDAVRGAYANVIYQRLGADDQQIARMRDYFAELCKGWKVEQVQQIVAETLTQLIHPYIYSEAAAILEEHRVAGRDIVLVSASGEDMVRPIGELLGVSDVIATRMATADGYYTGEIEFYAAGENKAVAVKALAEERGYDLAQCYAYSDSVSDVALLSCVGNPTAVNPDRGLRRTAVQHNWPILTFRHPVPMRQRILGEKHHLPVVTGAAVVAVALGGAAAWYTWRRRKPETH